MAPASGSPSGSSVDRAVAAARGGQVAGLEEWLSSAETPVAMLTTALRTRHAGLAEGMARAATGGALSHGEFLRHVLEADSLRAVLDPTDAAVDRPTDSPGYHRIAMTACVAALWCGLAHDEQMGAAGLRLFEALLEVHGPDHLPHHLRAIGLQQALLSGRPEVARPWLDLPLARPQIVHGVRVDLARMDWQEGRATQQEWLAAFSEPFTQSGCTPLELTGTGPTPYDQLTAAVPRRVEDGPLVTVLMPCWRPDEGLLTSVRSMLRQTWRPLEIMVLDDASGAEFDALFDRVAALDERITVLRLPANGGSYLARNHAISLARGEFVTVQDADDWSHPERIERHVRDLLAHPEAPANRSQAIRVKDDLTHQWLGYPPHRRNASSLMIRRRLFDEVGGFQAVRKGADSEYHFRLDALGEPVREMDDYLAVIRLSASSLSRGDFRWHYNNPDRLLYRAVYDAWHRWLLARGGSQAAARELARTSGVDDPRDRAFPVPRAWSRDLPGPDGGSLGADEEVTHDWVVRADFSQGRRMTQLRELLDAGVRPVLWHQERPLPVSRRQPRIDTEVADLIVQEGLTYISVNEPTLARNLLLLDPACASREVGAVRAEAVWVDADRLGESTGLASLIDLVGVDDDLRRSWAVEPVWVTRRNPWDSPVRGARRVPWRG